MDDLDDLFTAPLNGDLPDGLNEHLDAQLVDTLNDQLAITQNSIPPEGLLERLEELHAGGCNQTIAWSKLGALACINSDRKSITIRCLQFQSDGNWHLSEYTDPALNEQLGRYVSGHYDFVHVAWSPNGTDLIVIDSSGRIAIGYIFLSLNRVIIQRCQNVDIEDNLNNVVALRWLSTSRKQVTLSGTTSKENGRWKFPLAAVEPRGPFSPGPRPGFLIVTRGCMLKLFLQGNGPADWTEVKFELDGLSSSSEVITHAAMCSEKTQPKRDDEILLAIHTAARRLRLYSIRIDFQQDPSHPSIHVQHITQIDRCLPSPGSSFLAHDLMVSSDDAELCSLTLLPRTATSGQGDVPVIVATFSQTGLTGSTTTVVCRWELHELAATIDPTFAQLSTKKSAAARLSDERTLVATEDIHLDRLVIGLELTHNDSMIALFYSTGEVDMRERNLAIPLPEESTEKASILSRLGFAFDNPQPCLEIALSANAVVKASRNKTYECTLSAMHLMLPIIDTPATSQVAACFVLQLVSSDPMGSLPSDDLLMALWEFQQQLDADQRKAMNDQFLRDLYQLLQVSDKFGDDQIEVLMRSPAIGKCASIQSSLAVVPLGNGRLRWSRTGKIGFTVLSLRTISLLVTASMGGNRQNADEIVRPEVLDYISPQVKWFITLIDYVLDQLFDINRIMGTAEPFKGEYVKMNIEAAYGCLILVLSTVTRRYLRYIIKLLKALAALLGKELSREQPVNMARLSALSGALRSGTFSPMVLDSILESTDQVLNMFYAKLKPGQRIENEMMLLAEGHIPVALYPWIQKILSVKVEQIRVSNEDAEEKLAFKHWGPVSLVDDQQTVKWEKETVWDGVRKAEIKDRHAKKRVCLRCSGLMQELRLPRAWQSQLTRTCFCGGHWITVPDTS